MNLPAIWVLFRFAARDLRGGLEGLRIFLACIALGVAAIVAVNSLARSLDDGLARDGRVILGGDASFSLIHRELTPEERAFLQARGTLYTVANLRAMARNAEGDATLADLKAVDDSWPRLGVAALDPPLAPQAALAERDGRFGALVDDALLDRLGLKIGDAFDLGASASRGPRPHRFRAGQARNRHRIRRAGADFGGGVARERARPARLVDPLDDAGPAERSGLAARAMPRSRRCSRTRRPPFPKRAGRRARARTSLPTFPAISTVSASFWRWWG